ETVLTQTPDSLSVSPGDTVTLSCKASSTTGYLHWYQQKPGQAPKFLINQISNHPSGVADRCSGSGSGTDYTLRISRIEADDAGDYYCQQRGDLPPTVLQPCTTLDLVLSGMQNLVQRVTVAESLANSDHNIITFQIITGGRLVNKTNTITFNF
uniref:Ig-like domain-containing protein n=1 Tax=Sphenodon punctatus TaxID=8508 RepID=A0A8D0L4U9_SPHPU